MADLNFSVRFNDERIRNLIDNQIGNPSSGTRLAVNNTFAKRCDPYVPFLNGPLSQTVRITPEEIRYIQPYARYQYYGTHFNHTIEYHPLATALWDKAMMRDHGQEVALEIGQIMARGLELHDGR